MIMGRNLRRIEAISKTYMQRRFTGQTSEGSPIQEDLNRGVSVEVSSQFASEVLLQSECQPKGCHQIKDFERFFMLSLDMFCISGVDGYLKRLNPAWMATLGYSEQELLSTPYLEFIHPDDQAATIAEAKKLEEGAEIVAFHNRYRCKDGSYRWLAWTAKFFLEEGLVYGVARDITKEKQVEIASQLNQEQLQMALDASGDGIWDWNIATGSLYLSPQWLGMLGYEEGELPGKVDTWVKLVHPEDQPWVMDALQAHLADNSIQYRFDYRLLNKSGQWQWIANYGKVVVRDPNGTPLRMAGTHRDITQNKQKEVKLQEMSIALGNAVEGISQVDAQGCYIFVNQSYARSVGYSPEEMIGMSWQPTVHPDDLEIALAVFQQMLQGGKGEGEFRGIRKDGSIFYKHIVLINPYHEQQKYTGYYCFMKDVSDRKQREEIIHNIALGVSAEIGEAFFQSLVMYLSKALDVEYALIGELTAPGKDHLRIIAGFGNGQMMENFDYPLINTPCQAVISGEMRVYPNHVQRYFPKDAYLKKIGAESYLGTPLIDSKGQALGIISIFSVRPLTNTNLLEETLKIFSTRASSELERKKVEFKLYQQFQRSQLLADISLKIRHSSNIDEIFQTTVQEVKTLLEADRVLLLQVEHNGALAIVRESVDPQWPSVAKQMIVDECFYHYQDKYPQGRIDSTSDIVNSATSNCLLELLTEFQVRAKLVAPVLLQGKLWGLLAIHQCSAPREWSAHEVELVERLANKVGIALEKYQTEHALRKSQEHFRSLVEHMSDILVLVDKVGVIQYVSPSIQRILGYVSSDLTGKTLLSSLHLEDQAKFTEVLSKAYRVSGKAFPVSSRWIDRENNWRIFDMIAEKYEDATDFTGVMINARDVTDRVKMAEMSQKLAQEMEMNELKLRFFSMTSHEFRTPLSTILIASQILEGDEFLLANTKASRNIYRIQDAALHLRQMLTDVLTIARIEAQKLDFEPKSINLYEFCSQLVQDIQADVSREADIHFDFNGKNCSASMDVNLLHLILSNLLGNAVKYSPPKSKIDFVVCLTATEVIFKVKDQGIGISPNDQAHLYEVFRRGSNVGKIEGSGLGLAIVKKCVDLHQGQISCASEMGEGTQFVIWLPNCCD
jgi:PAS domain S-box-containing protein